MIGPGAARIAGRVLRAMFALLLLVRRPRPIHPRGVVLTGVFRRLPGRRPTGVSWIDEGGTDPEPVVARTSRSIGLPAPLPDIVGLAVRFRGERGPADLELASTGFAGASRFVLVPHRSPSRARLGTLIPYRTPSGPLLVAARTMAPDDLPALPAELAARLEREPWRLRLYVARPRGRWRPFGELELRRTEGPVDELVRFDAMRHLLPGVAGYRWIRAVRDPSYAVSQGAGDARSVEELRAPRQALRADRRDA